MILEIVNEIFLYVDGCMISVKKDGMLNIGGVFVMNDDEFVKICCNILIFMEGFLIYGGLVGYDLEVIVIGFFEFFDEDYLCY